MKAVICRSIRDEPDLIVGEFARPELKPGTMIIRAFAGGLNFADSLAVKGRYQDKREPPFVVGSEVAGEVVEAGEGAAFQPGERVMGMAETGAFAEYARLGSWGAARIPDDMPMDEAAAFFANYGTAYCALTQRARLAPGERVVILGAASGVGFAALQIAKAQGAEVVACSRDEEKRKVTLDHGADYALDHTAEDFVATMKALGDGRGADIVLDMVGGDATRAALRYIARLGRLVIIGFASGTIPQIPANYLLLKNCSAVGLFYGDYFRNDPDGQRAAFDAMFDMYAKGLLRPLVSEVIPLEAVPDAIARSAEGKVVGKIVVEIGSA